jgi:hypothetical protein
VLLLGFRTRAPEAMVDLPHNMKLMLAYHPRSIMGDHPDWNVAYESRFAEKEHRHNWRSVQSAK